MGNATIKKIKQVLWNCPPVLFIVFLWCFFAFPFFLFNKVPYPSTYQVNHFSPWNSYERFLGPVKNGAMPDVVDQLYPWRYFSIETWKMGQIPLWNPYSFSGTPHLANYQSAVLSPLNIIFFILPFVDAWRLLILLQPLLAGIGMYIYLKTIKIDTGGSLIGSVSFMFCGFMTVWRDYGTLSYAILFLPLTLYCIEKVFVPARPHYLVGIALSLPLSFFSGHFQTSIYFSLTVVVYLLWKLFCTKKVNAFLFSFLFFIFGMLLTLPQILPSIEFYEQSFRSKLFENGNGIPWQYLVTLFAPDFYGNPVTRNDWFGQYAEWSSFIGVVPLFLALFSLLKKGIHQKTFFVLVAITSLLLAFDTPLVDLLVQLHIPVLSTSATNRIIILFSFSLSVLSAFGYQELLEELHGKKTTKWVILWISCSIVLLFIGIVFFLFSPSILPKEKIIIARNNSILPIALFLFLEFFTFVSLLRKKWIAVFGILLLLLTSWDMYRFTTKWEPFDPKQLIFPSIPLTEYLEKMPMDSRMIGNIEAAIGMYYQLPLLGGYDALYIKNYGEFVSYIADNNYSNLERSLVVFPTRGKNVEKAINFLGVGYIIHKTSDNGVSWTFPFWDYPQKQFSKVFSDGKYEVYKNNNVLPRAFLVGRYRFIEKEEDQLKTFFSENFSPESEIILSEKMKDEYNTNDIGDASIVRYTPTQIDIHVIANKNGFLFLSDPYYPGWKAYSNNEERPIYKADYAFRAVPITQGDYIVSFIYEAPSFVRGVLFAALGMVGIVITSIVLLLKGRNNILGLIK